MAALADGGDYRLVRNSAAHAKALLRDPGPDPALVEDLCRTYARADPQLLRELKTALLVGIRAFEEHEAEVVERAGAVLVEALSAALVAVGDYYRALAAETCGHGVTDDLLPADVVEEPVPDDPGIPGHGGPIGGALPAG